VRRRIFCGDIAFTHAHIAVLSLPSLSRVPLKKKISRTPQSSLSASSSIEDRVALMRGNYEGIIILRGNYYFDARELLFGCEGIIIFLRRELLFCCEGNYYFCREGIIISLRRSYRGELSYFYRVARMQGNYYLAPRSCTSLGGASL
jgi:hypothetical protein